MKDLYKKAKDIKSEILINLEDDEMCSSLERRITREYIHEISLGNNLDQYYLVEVATILVEISNIDFYRM